MGRRVGAPIIDYTRWHVANTLPGEHESDRAVLNRFAAIRLIVLDLDGTLVRSRNPSVNALAIRLRRRLARHPIHVDVTVATGRAINGARRIIQDLGVSHKVPVILYNGAVLARPPDYQPLRIVHIAPSTFTRILDLLCDLPVVVFGYYVAMMPGGLFGPQERVLGWASIPNFEALTEFNGLPVEWRKGTVADTPDGGSLCAVLIDCRLADAAEVEDKLKVVHDVSVTRSGGPYVEIRPPASNKAAALQHLLHSMGRSRSEVLAIGDNDNDIEMLQAAGIGVVVDGASAQALLAADYVCNHGVVAGVTEVLRLIGHSRRYWSDDA